MHPSCPKCGGALAPGHTPSCACVMTNIETLPGIDLPDPDDDENAFTLRCPSCGAWIAAGTRRCTYCKADLATVRCWRCFELAFAGSAHCPGCAARLGLEGDLGPTEHRCPACTNDVLHFIEVGPHRLHECRSCMGVLVDHATFELLTRERENGVRALAGSPKRATLTVTAVQYRSCPMCSGMMRRKNFGEKSGVIVDVCAEHGIFFDAKELTHVLEFVATGGLERHRDEKIRDANVELARRRAEAIAQQHAVFPSTKYELAAESAGALISALLEWVW